MNESIQMGDVWANDLTGIHYLIISNAMGNPKVGLFHNTISADGSRVGTVAVDPKQGKVIGFTFVGHRGLSYEYRGTWRAILDRQSGAI